MYFQLVQGRFPAAVCVVRDNTLIESVMRIALAVDNVDPRIKPIVTRRH